MNKTVNAVNVLVFDDQPMIVEELREFLQSRGYRCVANPAPTHGIEGLASDPSQGLVICALHIPPSADADSASRAALERREAALLERQKSYQHLGNLNQKLQFLADSIDDLCHELDKARGLGTQRRASDVESEPDNCMPALFEQLSPRQLDVARLVSKGQTNYQIACELGITENTVKLYVSQVLRLTRTHNRTQLALALAPGNSPLRLRVTAH